MKDYEPAFREMHARLSWINGHQKLGRYLGWHIADVANDLIRRAYPDLDVPDLGPRL